MANSAKLLSDELLSKNTSGKEFDKKRRTIGLYTASSFILGTIIGAGIFLSPAGVLRYSGSVGGALIIWCCSGLIAAMGAICYLELGTMIPESGCDFVYIRACFGEFPAFLLMWTYVIIFAPVTNAIKSLLFANYILEPFFLNCAAPPYGIRMIAASAICK